MGTTAPTFHFDLLPLFGESSQILQTVSYLGLTAFVFTAGLEIELTGIWRQRRSTLITSISGIILPFALGYGVVVLLPGLWSIPSGDTRIFALFMGTALSISALPVIARILIDLDLLKEGLGGIIMGAATINDIIGWSIFALILSSLNSNSNLRLNLSLTIGVLLLTACIFCLAAKNEALQKSAIWEIFIDITALAMLIAAIASEFLGAHGIFCAFLAGAILSQRRARRDLILKKIYFPVMVILAPIYFCSIGIETNFIDYFDLAIVLLVFTVACIGKILGAGLAAAASGVEGRKAMAIGFGLNARGAMEIVLASAALGYGLIDESVFVALVVMALATTAISGLSLPWLMKMRPISQKAWDPLPLHEQMGSYNYLES